MGDTIGQLLRKDNTPHPGKQAVPVITRPAEIPFEAPPVLSTPKVLPAQLPPDLTVPNEVSFQPAPELTVPADVAFQPAPKIEVSSTSSQFQAPPVLTAPAVVGEQPAPALRSTSSLVPQLAPELTSPAVIPLEPPPVLSNPAVIPFEPAPPLRTPPVIPPEPAPPLPAPAVIPFEPAPPLTAPASMSFQPPPALSAPALAPTASPPPLRAPASMSFQPAPPLAAPAPVPPDPPSVPGPPRYSDSRVVNAEGGIGVNLPPPLGPLGFGIDFNSGLSTHSGKITSGLDIHLDQVPKQLEANVQTWAKAAANAAAQQAMNYATSAATNLISKAVVAVEDVLVQAVFGIDLNNQGTVAQAAQDAPGGALIAQPDPAPGRQPSPHKSPSQTKLEDLQVDPYWPDQTYARDSRAAAQSGQQDQANYQTAIVDSFNKWNDVSNYSDVMGPTVPAGLRDAYKPPANQQNTLSSIIKGGSSFDEKGYFPFNGTESALPNDDDVYVPLVFTDLRPSHRTQRVVYFRPFIKNLSETFAPQWNLGNYFGRVDPVATYKSTDRTISLGFKLVCFSPQDLAAIYRKLAWLTSMCYPEYSGGSYFAGPVLRLRVGDVISSVGGTTGKGISGILTSLDINYDDATWELTAGQKLPREIDVTVGFQVLHDAAIGIVSSPTAGMQFGGINGQTANVRQFRAAFGTIDYLNEAVPTVAGGTSVPALDPLQATSMSSFSPAAPAIPSLQGGSGLTSGFAEASNWPGSNADSFLG